MTTDDTPALAIGLGTGRSGTHSLTQLLDAAGDGRFPHEMSPHLPWDVDNDLLERRIEQLTRSGVGPVGDVAFYYLPYVELMLDHHTETRFIALRRDRAATVDSYLSKTEDRNHWMQHDGTQWRPDPMWDRCYPKYDVDDIETAIGRYWDEYYTEVGRLSELYPDSVRHWSTEALNEPDGVREILSFAGLDPDLGTSLTGVRTNRGTPPLSARIRAAIKRTMRT